MTLIFRLIIRRDIWIFHSKVFSSGWIKEWSDMDQLSEDKPGTDIQWSAIISIQ